MWHLGEHAQEGICLLEGQGVSALLRQKQTLRSPEKLQSRGQSPNPGPSGLHSERLRRHLPLAPLRPSPEEWRAPHRTRHSRLGGKNGISYPEVLCHAWRPTQLPQPLAWGALFLVPRKCLCLWLSPTGSSLGKKGASVLAALGHPAGQRTNQDDEP